MCTSARLAGLTVVVAALLLAVTPAAAQYFGRNKVQYDQFDWRVFKTEHFEFYFYPEEELAVKDAARMAERWYRRHSRTFLREFRSRKPILLYANDADFQQTNAISGQLGQGTGGVTESLKERVIMPLTGIYRETDHVLGHELVHSFQYDIALNSTDSSRFALQLVPLWLVEGMAEYLSLGRDDPHTAMWMRDAALRDDLPTIAQLGRDFRYFPYRYGQAYLAYVGGKYGDAAVANLYKLSGLVGLDSAFVYTLGITADSLSKEWAQAIKEAYLPLTEGRTPATEAGRLVIAKEIDGGEINVAPVVSPDGQYVAFLSERDIFNINLFIADANTGKVVKRLKGTNSNPHFDAIRFIASAGSWSPDGKKFAFITFVEGDNEIAILDWNSGDIERRIAVDGVSAIMNLAWSPDGRTLAFSGMDGGISDLYLLDLRSNVVRQLTNDRYADLQPAWSPDGRTLAFVTDRGPGGTDFETLAYGKERLALIDIETGEIRVLKPFGDDVMHTNPQFSPDGRSLFFLSTYEGFKDVYRLALDPAGDEAAPRVFRVTRLQTGVSGITALSPAMSVALQSGRMMFSVFSGNHYNVFSLEPEQLRGEPVALPEEATPALAGILPPFRALHEGLVGNYLHDPLTGLPDDVDYEIDKYGARLKLDYVAPPTLGVAAGGPFGTALVGGIALFFSDMLGDHNLMVVAQANGTFKDIGAQVAYLNRGHRINYGASAAHIPYLIGGTRVGLGVDPETGQTAQIVEQLRQRIFIDMVEGLASYPLSTTRRIELSGGFTRYGFDIEVDRYYITSFQIRRERDEFPAPDPIYFGTAGLALVTDYSSFGFTSPVRGGRSRFDVSPFVGTERFVRVLADYRRYFFINPVTLAFRGLHLGNYGASESDDLANSLFTQEYLGYANSLTFVRGYSFSSFEGIECTPTDQSTCAEFDRLLGSRIALASLELRIPLLGTEQFGLLNFPYLPTEIAFFADGGLAWTKDEAPVLKFERDTTERVPVFSVGVTGRFNLFGYTVIEIFYAKPFQRPIKGAHFGFQIIPGW
ncbi:BamA/TamA family outer membrane protein [Rhodocaloribacter litoris]|uniref:BamA/TamA family outer membrane protein n=1 Tax=Rhodocaloribacter litoris TaxID=2558931 RepID=UPI00141ED09B|nr:BamA/TamA family outer membrane protein [Rhodocaloribacter litoris]QXD16570.1 BamA/TamA family outer membrane protein [Rhodocaloribacter litoris]